MGIRLQEHKKITIFEEKENVSSVTSSSFSAIAFAELSATPSKAFNKSSHCFKITHEKEGISLEADYCIGIDWIGKTGRTLYVEPKINAKAAKRFESIVTSEEAGTKEEVGTEWEEASELNYLEMLIDAMNLPNAETHLAGLVKINWEAETIPIEQKDDRLTPFLIVQFLKLLQKIVRKGLRRSYYTVRENLNSRVKGKILVGQHVKQNVMKNRLTKTICEFQVFDIDNAENRFLKKVLRFASNYVDNNPIVFKSNLTAIQQVINYVRPAFELVTDDQNDGDLKQIKYNAFFKEYKDAVRIGQYILKRFSYSISQTALTKVSIPPFWIDMPRLFELYVYQILLKDNPEQKNAIHYQFSTYGNALDILVAGKKHAMVIDAKYKLHYKHGHLHQDIRQLSGYARLEQVLRKIAKVNQYFDSDKVLPCLVIYPDLNADKNRSLHLENLLLEENKIEVYREVYKLGISLPLL